MADRRQPRPSAPPSVPGAWLLTVSAFAGLIASLVYYFWRGDGIAYTDGALVVIGSTAILLIAGLVLIFDTRRHWFTSAFFNVGACIDILGTGFAAWMLDAYWLLGLMCLAGMGWLVHVAFDAGAQPAAGTSQPRLQESS